MGRLSRDCLAPGRHVELRSKSGKSLARYFPEIVAALLATRCDDYVLDGELILPMDGILSFDALQARLHPAESRILRLSHETPAQLMLFDCLALGGTRLTDRPLAERRAALERFHARRQRDAAALAPRLGPGGRASLARRERRGSRRGHRQAPRPALSARRARDAQGQAAPHGGLRRRRFPPCQGQPVVASLLLGLYDGAGCSTMSASPRRLQAGPCRVDRAAGSADRAARLHRQGTGRAEPVERRQGKRMAWRSSRNWSSK
jgi:hypothetical protein